MAGAAPPTLPPAGQAPFFPKCPLKAVGSATGHTSGESQTAAPDWTLPLRSPAQAEAGQLGWSECPAGAPCGHQGCGIAPPSGHRQGPASERVSEQNTKSISFSPPPAPFIFLSKLYFKKSTVQLNLVAGRGLERLVWRMDDSRFSVHWNKVHRRSELLQHGEVHLSPPENSRNGCFVPWRV